MAIANKTSIISCHYVGTRGGNPGFLSHRFPNNNYVAPGCECIDIVTYISCKKLFLKKVVLYYAFRGNRYDSNNIVILLRIDKYLKKQPKNGCYYGYGDG